MTYREDGGRVVVDGIDARPILPEEQHASDEQPPLQIRSPAKRLEGLPETNTDGRLLLLVDLVDGGNLLGDVHVRGLQLANPAQVLHALTSAVLEKEPARGFANPQRPCKEQAGGDQLHGERDDPLLTAGRQMLFDAVLVARSMMVSPLFIPTVKPGPTCTKPMKSSLERVIKKMQKPSEVKNFAQ